MPVLVQVLHPRIDLFGGPSAAFDDTLYTPHMRLGGGVRTGKKKVGQRCSLGWHMGLGSGRRNPFRLKMFDAVTGKLPPMPDFDLRIRKFFQGSSAICISDHVVESSAGGNLSPNFSDEFFSRTMHDGLFVNSARNAHSVGDGERIIHSGGAWRVLIA